MVCPSANRQLMSFDYYGEMLVDCICCNRGGRPAPFGIRRA